MSDGSTFAVPVFKFIKNESTGENVRTQVGTVQATKWIDPTSGKEYTAPVGYNPQDTINRFYGEYTNNAILTEFAADMLLNTNRLVDFRRDGPLDLQRNFNGTSFGGFVEDFRDIASFDYGLAASATGLSKTQIEMAGGIVNAKNLLNKNVDTSGIYFNNPRNIPNIENGIQFFRSYWEPDAHVQAYFLNHAVYDADFTKAIIQVSDDIASILPTSPTNIFAISNFAGAGAGKSSSLALTSDYLDGLVTSGGNWQVNLPGSILNSNGLKNVSLSSMLSDGWRPGAGELSDYSMSHFMQDLGSIWGPVGYNFYNEALGGFDSFIASTLGKLDNYASNASSFLNIDPLVVDVSGSGISLSNYQQSNILFNMDSDAYKEQTGWIRGGTGFVVLDKNGDGVINDVSEIFSEYFTSGVKNGLEALAMLDSNHDGVFDAGDAAYTRVKLWQDANNNGQTDAGELASLTSLRITAISLAGTAGNGALINGNEVQATTTATIGGVAHAVAAVNFLVNPDGHEWDLTSQGVVLHSEAGGSSYSVSNMQGETVDVAALGVTNAYGGGGGSDTLLGGARHGIVIGGGAGDVLYGLAGNGSF